MLVKIIDPETNKVVAKFEPLKEIDLEYTNLYGLISWKNITIETTTENEVPKCQEYDIELQGLISCTIKGRINQLTFFGKNDGTIYLTYTITVHSIRDIHVTGENSQLLVAEAYDRAMEIIKTRKKNVY